LTITTPQSIIIYRGLKAIQYIESIAIGPRTANCYLNFTLGRPEMNTAKTAVIVPTVAGVLGFVSGIAFLLFFNANAGDLEPDAPPGPTMKTLDEVEPRFPITEVPYTINEPGSYYFTGDLESPIYGILVNADNVTIDLMGYSLIGPGPGGSYGVYMNGRKNVEIRNGTVRDFGVTGIFEESNDGMQHRIIAVRVVSNGDRGIDLSGTLHQVRDCAAVGNQDYGIYVGSSSIVSGNQARDNGTLGIRAYSGCTVTGNTACYNGRTGISTSVGSTVANNTAYGNGIGTPAMYEVSGIDAGTASTVIGNTAFYNGELAEGTVYGIRAGSGSTVANNSAYDNGPSSKGPNAGGIYASSGCTVTGNTAYRNGKSASGTVYGIFLGGSNLVDQNTSYDNSGTNMNTPATCTFGVNEY
jgi:parallel beta-helix repeat protein